MPIKRAALYIRVSSDEQARHGLSLGEQRSDLLSYAEAHKYAVAGVYADEGVSARKSYRSRKELQRLLRDVEAGEIDVIVMKCLDRWFRNVKDYYKVQEILDRHGVLWECSQDRYDTTTAAGRLNLHIRLAIAEEESDRTGERIRYVFRGKKERHELLTGNTPIGYVLKEKHLVPDDNAPIVQFMFQHVHAGNSAYSVPKAVMKEFGFSITYRQVWLALRNRTYLGERYGIPGFCPELVPADVFEHVQTLIHSHGHSRFAPSGRVYLFSGLIRCPSCGRNLNGNPGTANAQGEYNKLLYRCGARMSDGPGGNCTFTRSIYEQKIEGYLLDHLQEMIANHIYEVNHVHAQQEKRTGDTIESLNAKLARLKDLYVDGLIDKDTYRSDYEELQAKVSKAARAEDNPPRISPALKEIANEKGFRDTYESLTRENQRIFWHSIIEHIDFDDLPENRGKGKTIHFRVTFL